MEWQILFVVSWLLFMILADWKTFNNNVWGGIAAIGLQILVDTHSLSHGLYRINNPGVEILGSSLFFTAGPVFVIGTLLVQFHPVKKWFTILNVVMLAVLYSLQELLLLKRNSLYYISWHFVDSTLINLSAMIILSWISTTILKRKGFEGD